MTSRDFAFWLQGFFEITNPTEITPEQTKMIQAHLNLVFVHEIDPAMGDQRHQDVLNKIHATGKEVTPKEMTPPFRPHTPVEPYFGPGSRDKDGNVMRC